LDAVIRSSSAPRAGPSATCVEPDVCSPGGNPVIDVPGERPISPPIVVGPVLVIALPANTAYDADVPRFTVAVAAIADWVPNAASVMNAITITVNALMERRRDL
jgi:hypothetical protein